MNDDSKSIFKICDELAKLIDNLAMNERQKDILVKEFMSCIDILIVITLNDYFANFYIKKSFLDGCIECIKKLTEGEKHEIHS